VTSDRSDPIVEFPALKDALGKLDASRKSLADIFAEAGPDYDMSKVKSLSGDSHDKVAEIGKLNNQINERKAKVDELMVVARAAANAATGEQEAKGAAETGTDTGTETKSGGKLEAKGFAQRIVESAAVKGFKPGMGSGPQDHLDIELKTLFQESGPGWAPQSLRTGTMIEFATRPAPRVVDFLPQTTTQFPSVVYMEETTFTNAAAEVAEGGAYPESALALTEKTSPVQKIATYLPVTDEQFEDVPRAQAYIENRLPFMLRQRLDSQILLGNGTPPNLLGLENVSGINVQALGADPIPDAIYKGLRKIRDTGFAEPNAIFIAPAKWEGVALLKTADGIYIWGHPATVGPTTLWGVQVIQTTAGTSTKATMGDFANFSELAVRRGVDIQISNSHSTYFTEGKLAVRCDLRSALIWYRPAAFSVVTGL
jgi:HK97 family phage major capsid protein